MTFWIVNILLWLLISYMLFRLWRADHVSKDDTWQKEDSIKHLRFKDATIGNSRGYCRKHSNTNSEEYL